MSEKFYSEFQKMTEHGREETLAANPEWTAKFNQVKHGEADALELIYSTESRLLLCFLAEYLQEQAKLETSTDACEHFDGYVARVNLNICMKKISKIKKN